MQMKRCSCQDAERKVTLELSHECSLLKFCIWESSWPSEYIWIYEVAPSYIPVSKRQFYHVGHDLPSRFSKIAVTAWRDLADHLVRPPHFKHVTCKAQGERMLLPMSCAHLVSAASPAPSSPPTPICSCSLLSQGESSVEKSDGSHRATG